jgi:hypothetical protein
MRNYTRNFLVVVCGISAAAFAFGTALAASRSFFAEPAPSPVATRDIAEALGWMRNAPKNTTNFEYAMTARVRLLVFWAGKDDVGGGYIRRGFSSGDRRQESIQVLFGSDPAKAPKAINRWGAGTEVLWHKDAVSDAASGSADDVVSSAFFGFMKSSKGKSASEMQQELKKEKDGGEHLFTGILSRVDAGRAVSVTVPLSSPTDFNLHQYSEAEPLIFEKLSQLEDRPVRELSDTQGCARSSEFLATVAQLMDAALKGQTQSQSLCYVYNAEVNTLTLARVSPLEKLAVQVKSSKGEMMVDRTYQDLLETQFYSTNEKTGKRSDFTIALGTKGDLRGVPVQIRYQPNWWFQVVLNLRPETLTAAK